MRRFIVSRYILREHLGPFVFSFALITLIFLLDLVFRHLSRILSKGLPLPVVFEFFGLNMAWIIATAVPMAVLTATLMAFGRLAADQEITALQASGFSLWRLITPVLLVAGLLATGLIWFNNNILPDFNHRARRLAADITRKKPGVKIEPGVWFQEIPDYKLLVKALEDSLTFSKVYDLIIDDNTDPNVRCTISARSGIIESSPHAGMLFFTLFEGEIQEVNIKKLEEFRRVKFTKHSMSLQAQEGMFWQRRETDTRTDREKSAAAIQQETDEIRARIVWLAQRINLLVGMNIYPYFNRTFSLVPDSLVHFLLTPRPHASFLAQQKQLLAQITSLLTEMQERQQTVQSLMVEIHKKYAIPVACFVFVLIGAPMGVLARRGDLTTGVSLSLGFFLLYWAFLIGGEDLADRQMVSPFVAMWAANFLVGGFGILVFRRISFGRLAPMSLSLTNWFGRISLKKLREKFQRQPQNDSFTIDPIRLNETGEAEPGVSSSAKEYLAPDEAAWPAPLIELPPPLENSHSQPEAETFTIVPLHLSAKGETLPSVPGLVIEDRQSSEVIVPAPEMELPAPQLRNSTVTSSSPDLSPVVEVTAPHSSHSFQTDEALTPQQLEFTPVPKILRHLTQRTRADLVLFADCNGVPLAYCKNPATELPPQTDLEMIAKLSTGQMAATREINRQLGENQNFISLLQEGERRNLFIYGINSNFILIVLFEKMVMLGMVRVSADEAVSNLRKALNQIQA